MNLKNENNEHEKIEITTGDGVMRKELADLGLKRTFNTKIHQT